MKYIRMKDDKLYQFIKIEEIGDTVVGYEDEYQINHYLGGHFLRKSNILKQADTVEDLIDEIFFVDDEDNSPHNVIRYNPYKDENKKLTECRLEIGGLICWLEDYQKQHKGKIKGAIYTEKGIIYVTEMNEQGDWVLYEK